MDAIFSATVFVCPCAEKYATSVFEFAVSCFGALPEELFAEQEANRISVASIKTAVIIVFNLAFIFFGMLLQVQN